jgi:hypothetical protein
MVDELDASAKGIVFVRRKNRVLEYPNDPCEPVFRVVLAVVRPRVHRLKIDIPGQIPSGIVVARLPASIALDCRYFVDLVVQAGLGGSILGIRQPIAQSVVDVRLVPRTGGVILLMRVDKGSPTAEGLCS